MTPLTQPQLGRATALSLRCCLRVFFGLSVMCLLSVATPSGAVDDVDRTGEIGGDPSFPDNETEGIGGIPGYPSLCTGGDRPGQVCCPAKADGTQDGRCVSGTCSGGERDGEKCCEGTSPTPDGTCNVRTLIYRAVAIKTGDKTADFKLGLKNESDIDIDIILCAMLDLKPKTPPDLVAHARWTVTKVAGKWKCVLSGTASFNPSYHFGCKKVSIPKGKSITAIHQTAEFSKSIDNRLGAIYFDLLNDCDLDGCDALTNEMDVWLKVGDPADCQTNKNCSNFWAGHKRFADLAKSSTSLAVILDSLEAIGGSDGITLRWETAAEIDNEGFNVVRSRDPDTGFDRVNSSLIPAEGGPAFSTSYEYVDASAKPGKTYYYELEDIGTSGLSTFHGAGPCTFGIDPDCEPLAASREKTSKKKKKTSGKKKKKNKKGKGRPGSHENPDPPSSTSVTGLRLDNGLNRFEWPSGNWITMGEPDVYPARLEGTVRGAPAGATVVFGFSGIEGGSYIVADDPDDPSCRGLDLAIDEFFVIPPSPDARDSITVLMPGGSCGVVAENSVMRLNAVVTADEGAPVYHPGEFMYGVDGLFVRDTEPPIIESMSITEVPGGVLVDVEATDATSVPIAAKFVYSMADGHETQLPVQPSSDASRPHWARFSDLCAPLPMGVPMTYRVDVYDDVGNRTSSEPRVMTLEPQE